MPITSVAGETLSTFPINYEHANYRKGSTAYHSMLTPNCKDNPHFWLSNQIFKCMVPSVPGLKADIASGDFVLSNKTPDVTLDVVTIQNPTPLGCV